MRYENTGGILVPKIGFGTWRIGGHDQAESNLDATCLSALRTALECGYTHFDTAEIYASGHAEELLGRAIRDSRLSREKFFITSKVSPEHLQREAVLQSCHNSLRRLGMDYIDLYLIHWPPKDMSLLDDAFRGLNSLVETQRIKHVGVSNFNLKWLKQAQKFSNTPIITDQVPYRLPDKEYVNNGVLEFCQNNDILITAYSPVKFRNLSVNKTIRSMAEDQHATPHQIALAWLIHQPRVITIPMSLDPVHIRENIEAINIALTEKEITTLGNLY